MKLELEIIDIKDVQFANKTRINNRILEINQQELQNLLQQDKRFSRIDIELAHPGESCRILQVSDVIEPRAKVGEDVEDFPGAVGKHGTVGEGKRIADRAILRLWPSGICLSGLESDILLM